MFPYQRPSSAGLCRPCAYQEIVRGSYLQDIVTTSYFENTSNDAIFGAEFLGVGLKFQFHDVSKKIFHLLFAGHSWTSHFLGGCPEKCTMF